MLFVNLPVADVAATRAFFTAIGFRFDALFCDAGTLCMDVDGAKVMFHQRRRFAGYAARPEQEIDGAREAVVAVSASSRREVDERADLAAANGAGVLRGPEDLGFMYCRSFCDLDDHAWEIVWMNPAEIPQS